MRIGIVGYGTVGSSLERLFDDAGLDLVIYDKYKAGYREVHLQQQINECDIVFIAVPTPTTHSGCDISAVEEVVKWVERPMCIKSTVIPGTTDCLASRTGKSIVFSPEYTGETTFHPYRRNYTSDLVVVGGARADAQTVAEAYKLALGPTPQYFITDAVTAELAKYMENCFFATKVAFVAQFYLLAKKFGADFDVMREVWLADARVGRSHSAVIGSLGFGGRCLPKDLAAIIRAAGGFGGAPLLEAVQQFNDALPKAESAVEPAAVMNAA